MNRKNMLEFLTMESFDADVSFSMTKKEMIDFLQEKDIPFGMPTEMQIVVKSKILALDIDFYIDFQFKGEKLTALTMSPDMALEGKALHSRYNVIQKALENELGHSHNFLLTITNLLAPDSRLIRWHKNGIVIEHYLLNRFGMEEIINIELQ